MTWVRTQCPAEAHLKDSFRCWLAQHILQGISFSAGGWSERLRIVESLSSLKRLAASDSSQTIPTLELLESCIREASETASGHRNFRDERTLGLERTLLQGMMAYDKHASMCIAGRLVFVTEKGYLGSGPEWAETGDSLWVVPGFSIILVFRKHPVDSSCYQLVGEAYMHGLNLGEAVKDESQWKEVCLL
jgi:hypothetical protein